MTSKGFAHAFLAAVLAVLSGSACNPAFLKHAKSSGDLLPGETILVGKIDLSPPLGGKEQELQQGMFSTSERLRGKVYIYGGSKMREIARANEGLAGARELNGGIEAELSKDFFVRLNYRPFIMITAMIALKQMVRPTGPQSSVVDSDYIYLPGGLRVDVKTNDRAVYMGTIRYHRNEFFDIKKVEILDEFTQANRSFQKMFGAKMQLRKALAEPIRK